MSLCWLCSAMVFRGVGSHLLIGELTVFVFSGCFSGSWVTISRPSWPVAVMQAAGRWGSFKMCKTGTLFMSVECFFFYCLVCSTPQPVSMHQWRDIQWHNPKHYHCQNHSTGNVAQYILLTSLSLFSLWKQCQQVLCTSCYKIKECLFNPVHKALWLCIAELMRSNAHWNF